MPAARPHFTEFRRRLKAREHVLGTFIKSPTSHPTEILGGQSSFNVMAATAKFRADNPKLYAAFLNALEEATNRINADKKWAAELYLRAANDKTPLEEMLAMMNDPSIAFTLKAQGIAPFVDFMVKTGAIKVPVANWKDLFFPDAKGLN